MHEMVIASASLKSASSHAANVHSITCAVCDRQNRTSRRRFAHSSCDQPTAIVFRSPRNCAATSVDCALIVPGRSVVRIRYGCSAPRASIGGCRSRVDAAVTDAMPLTLLDPPGVDGVGSADDGPEDEAVASRTGVDGAM